MPWSLRRLPNYETLNFNFDAINFETFLKLPLSLVAPQGGAGGYINILRCRFVETSERPARQTRTLFAVIRRSNEREHVFDLFCASPVPFIPAGYCGKKCLVDFAIAHQQHPPTEPLPPRVRQFLVRCKKFAAHHGESQYGHLRSKRRKGGGRPPSEELEYGVFNWYLDMYKATSARIWPSTIRRAAEVG